MADGNVYKVFEAVFRPVNLALEGLFYAGALYGSKRILGFTLECFSGVRTYFLPWGNYSTSDLTKTFGKCAIIIGGTSGIGLAYAHEFARKKLNLVLISRSYDDLINIVSDLQAKYNIRAMGIHADFSLGPKVFREIEELIEGLEIGILVNNIAIRYDHPQYFALLPHQRMWQLIDVNVVAPTVITHMILPQMVERRRGAIINVCSVASCAPPIPLISGYTATIAYMDTLSQTLHYENRHRGVIVQTLLPCYVAKEGVEPSLFTPSPATYVRHAITTLGISNRTCGYWPHALQNWVCNFIPRWLWIQAMTYFNTHKRTQCLQESRQRRNNARVFTRKKTNPHISRSRYNSTASRQSEISFGPSQRTPSPHRKLVPIEPSGRLMGGAALSALQPPAVRRVSREEGGNTATPFRSSTGGSSNNSLASPIPEHPSPTTSTPLSANSESGHPSSVFGPDGFKFGNESSLSTQPVRASSADSAGSGGGGRPQTPTFLRKHSKVMVTPSVATVSYNSETQQEEQEGSSD